MSSSVTQTPQEYEASVGALLDAAVAIASKRGRTRIAAVNNILEVLESESGGESAIALTIAFILRQAGRGIIEQPMAQKMAEELMSILKNPNLDSASKKETARKLLGLVKWVIETADGFLSLIHI